MLQAFVLLGSTELVWVCFPAEEQLLMEEHSKNSHPLPSLLLLKACDEKSIGFRLILFLS